MGPARKRSFALSIGSRCKESSFRSLGDVPAEAADEYADVHRLPPESQSVIHHLDWLFRGHQGTYHRVPKGHFKQDQEPVNLFNIPTFRGGRVVICSVTVATIRSTLDDFRSTD